jgi:transposase
LVPEVRCVLLATAEPDEEQRALQLGWSVPNAAKRRAEPPNAPSAKRNHPSGAGGGGPKTTAIAPEITPEEAPLTNEEWEMFEPLIPQRPPAGRTYNDHRTVLGGILWVARAGCPWREMPEEFGRWETAYRRYELWAKQGLWQRILRTLGEKSFPGPATKERN